MLLNAEFATGLLKPDALDYSYGLEPIKTMRWRLCG